MVYIYFTQSLYDFYIIYDPIAPTLQRAESNPVTEEEKRSAEETHQELDQGCFLN